MTAVIIRTMHVIPATAGTHDNAQLFVGSSCGSLSSVSLAGVRADDCRCVPACTAFGVVAYRDAGMTIGLSSTQPRCWPPSSAII